MANLSTTTQVPAGVNNYYDKATLAWAEPELVHTFAAQQRPLPSKSSSRVKLRRYTKFSTATTALTEGVTPAAQPLSVTDLTLDVSQYGAVTIITDMVNYTVEDNVLNETAQLLGAQMGETVDEIVRDALASTLSATNCSAGVNGSTPTELTYKDIQGVVKTLKGNDAKMFTPMIGPVNKFASAPVRDAYWVMAHTDLLDDLEAIDKFIPVANYASQTNVMPSEWGQVGNTRWLLSSKGYSSSGTYSCFVVGRDAYGMSKLQEGISETIFKPYGHGDDYLNQRSTMGWKTLFGARVLNDNWIVKLNATHSS